MGRPLALALPFEGLAVWAQALFYAVLVQIALVFLWTLVLFISSRRAIRSAPDPEPTAADSLLWIFVVPALDEEVTIADSVERLRAVEAPNKAIIVVDDGSTDGTGAALAGLAGPDLHVVTRVAPDAREGKAAALNAAWRHVEAVVASGRWASWPRERIVIVVVDADGRLDPDSPAHVAPFFADEHVGGLQVLVRIYNRDHPLTWCQDVEFSIYGLLFQAGRTPWGTAGMGGNGQFHRLVALDSIADAEAGGPWRNRLTEDQDLGLRLIGAGWRGVSSSRTAVSQQGVPSLRRLLRQRTRWAQGNLQAMSHLGRMWRTDLPLLVRLDLIAYLLQPVMQAVVGIAFVASIFLWILDVADFWGDNGWIQLLFFFLLGYGGVLLGCIARGAQRGPVGLLVSVLVVPVYAAYSWMIWPVLARAEARQLARRTDWAKTAHQVPPQGDRPQGS